jgi:inosine-uridine nucleoside N-ribohydrolase
MDFDDASALAYVCQQHRQGRIDLRAVTVVNDGAGLPGSAIRHARCVLAACGLSDVPIADGSPVGINPVPPELAGAVEIVLEGALVGCEASTAPAEISAPELLIETIRASRERVRVLTTGPLTNLSTALEMDVNTHLRRGAPIRARIADVVVMGGALRVPGDLFGTGSESFDGTQEFNIWADPRSAQNVFYALNGKVRVVPLDATQYVPVTAAFAARLDAYRSTAEAQLVHAILSQPITQFGISLGAFFWWDPLAAVVTAGDEGVVDFERDRIAVVQDGPAAGRTQSTPHGARLEVGTYADQPAFEDAFLDGLNGR